MGSLEQRTAVRRLEVAMIEQSRVGEALERSTGTSSEQGAYARARTAAEYVSTCDEAVKALDAEVQPRVSAPVP
jgi:hypothetical protein